MKSMKRFWSLPALTCPRACSTAPTRFVRVSRWPEVRAWAWVRTFTALSIRPVCNRSLGAMLALMSVRLWRGSRTVELIKGGQRRVDGGDTIATHILQGWYVHIIKLGLDLVCNSSRNNVRAGMCRLEPPGTDKLWNSSDFFVFCMSTCCCSYCLATRPECLSSCARS